ncbi:MAG: hypothetical protein J6C59_11245 [Muribaculaceae bacterium]|nr:hypothetical protein [Muribaculaceae bacterium]
MSKPVIKRTYVHWRGSFVAIGGTVWEVEILRPEKVLNPVELSFPADEPLVVEWDDITPESTVTGSTATLKVISATDREFTDLYVRQPGEVRLAVWRRNPDDTRTLYWQGSLDPEFYEEPYETLQGYDVTLTFSDFGYMDRIDFDLRGLLDYGTLLKHCLEQSGFDADFAPMKIGEGISTRRNAADEEPLKLADLAVDARNFYDEEGKPQTLRQVAEGLLQPLALHMVQTGGAVWVYDDNWLAAQRGVPGDGIPAFVRWDGDEQTLSAAETYNNVRISFSGYADGDLGLRQPEYRGKTGKGAYNPWPTFDSSLPGHGSSRDDYGLYFTYSYNNHLRKKGENWFDLDTAYRSFTLFLNDAAGTDGKPLVKGFTLHQTTADPQGAADGLYGGTEWVTDLYGGTAVGDKWPKAFRIEPFCDGSETEGVAVSITTGGKITDTYGKQRPSPAFYDTTETVTALDPTPRLFGQTVRYGLDCAEIWYAAGEILEEWVYDIRNGIADYSYFDYMMRYARHPWTVKGKKLTPQAADLRVLTTEPVYLPPVDDPSDYYVNFKVEMLLSALYNPFSGADSDNEITNNNDIKIRSRWVFVPFTAVIRDGDGRITHHYSNIGTMETGRPGYFNRPDIRQVPADGWLPAGEIRYNRITGTYDDYMLYGTNTEWAIDADYLNGVTDPEPSDYFGQAWLAWYEPDEDGETSAIAAGFKANRHCIGRGDTVLLDSKTPQFPKTVFSRSFKKMPDGQFLPYPPQGGWLEVTLYRTVLPMDDRGSEHDGPGLFSPLTYLSPQEWLERGLEGKGPDNGGRRGMFNAIRWHLFKAPEIEVVRADGSFGTAETDDAEYSGYLDRDAREDLPIDTTVGTLPGGDDCPSAKGLLRFADNGKPVRLLTRGGVTACPEKLLIGSLYSQYSQRRTVLSGVARLQPQWYGPHLLRDAAQDDWYTRRGETPPRFRISGQTADLRLGQAELTLTEIRPDSYEPADIEEVDE